MVELSRSDRRVAELVDVTRRPQNLVSYHLGRLRTSGLVQERRSSADGRDIYYHLDLARLKVLYRESGEGLHPSVVGGGLSATPLDERPLRVLFLCTHNSARSQMAEALLRQAAGPRVVAASAGSEPATLHPLAVGAMAGRGIDISGQHSKHMEDLLDQGWDLVITVCDRVREVCPAFPSQTRTAHWSIADPAAVEGPERERLAAFEAAADELAARVSFLADELAQGLSAE